MAYNSDGYIMIDFTEVDFRRTNQTIEGLYKRCVDVIGTNKFILVINANGRTPLPATCSFTNNQYVIDTVIYMFAVSSNDNLFIRRNDVPASDIIDDSSISVDKTWSSNKIDSELDGKQDTLTAGTNIIIDENNVISSTGGAVIDDSVIVNNKVWSSLNTVEKLAPIDTIVTNPANFKTSLELPLVECSTSFMCTQEGSGDPSPSNPRAIVGVDDITLTVNGNSVVIDLDGTRYGGYVDVVGKKLVVTWVSQKISDMQVAYQPASTGYPFGFYILRGTPRKKPGVSNVASEIFKVGGIIWSVNYRSFGNGSNDYIYVVTSDYSSADDFKSNWGTYEFAYELETPIEISLSDIPTLSTIIGNNSFESDTGSIKVSYKYLPEDLF